MILSWNWPQRSFPYWGNLGPYRISVHHFIQHSEIILSRTRGPVITAIRVPPWLMKVGAILLVLVEGGATAALACLAVCVKGLLVMGMRPRSPQPDPEEHW